jgi:hypothetical protein
MAKPSGPPPIPTLDDVRAKLEQSLLAAAVPGGPAPGDTAGPLVDQYLSDAIGYLLGAPKAGSRWGTSAGSSRTMGGMFRVR